MGNQGNDRGKVDSRSQPQGKRKNAQKGEALHKGNQEEGAGGQDEGKQDRPFVAAAAGKYPGEKEGDSVTQGVEDEKTARPGVTDGEFVFYQGHEGGKDRPGAEVHEPQKPQKQKKQKGFSLYGRITGRHFQDTPGQRLCCNAIPRCHPKNLVISIYRND